MTIERKKLLARRALRITKLDFQSVDERLSEAFVKIHKQDLLIQYLKDRLSNAAIKKQEMINDITALKSKHKVYSEMYWDSETNETLN